MNKLEIIAMSLSNQKSKLTHKTWRDLRGHKVGQRYWLTSFDGNDKQLVKIIGGHKEERAITPFTNKNYSDLVTGFNRHKTLLRDLKVTGLLGMLKMNNL